MTRHTLSLARRGQRRRIGCGGMQFTICGRHGRRASAFVCAHGSGVAPFLQYFGPRTKDNLTQSSKGFCTRVLTRIELGSREPSILICIYKIHLQRGREMIGNEKRMSRRATVAEAVAPIVTRVAFDGRAAREGEAEDSGNAAPQWQIGDEGGTGSGQGARGRERAQVRGEKHIETAEQMAGGRRRGGRSSSSCGAPDKRIS